MSNDLLWLVAHTQGADFRGQALEKAIVDFETRDWTDQGTGRTIILDIEAGLQHDRWALFPDRGDPILEPADYWRCRRWLAADAATPRHPLIESDTIGRAVADIAAHHCLAAGSAFLKDAWTHQQVLSLDAFYFHFHSLLRAEAWSLERVDALTELTTGDVAEADSLPARAQALAGLDLSERRDPAALTPILEREFNDASERLQHARTLRYADFLRAAYAIRPVLYTLRDLYWELHFLSGEDAAGAFIEQERLVDEWQADAFQMLLSPYAPMVEIGLDTDMSESQVRRHLAFWTRGRLQLNEEMRDLAMQAFRSEGLAAMLIRLDAARRAALDPSRDRGDPLLPGEGARRWQHLMNRSTN